MTTRTAARHRAASRGRTPLGVIGDAVSSTGVTRRSAVLAASSGLIVTMGLPAAAATHHADAAPDASTGTTQQMAAVPAAARVSVPLDAQVSFALSALTTVDAAQFQHDAAVAQAERGAAAARASRSAARAALAQAAATKAAAAAATRTTATTRTTTATGGATATATGRRALSTASTASGATGVDAVALARSTGAGSAAAVDIAKRYFGIHYRYGGTTPAGFDCSGFVRYVYQQLGVSLPRTASEQAASGTRVSADQARPGDIVSYLGRGGVYHNGIYTGAGKMIDSPRTGQAIAERPVFSSSVVFTRVG